MKRLNFELDNKQFLNTFQKVVRSVKHPTEEAHFKVKEDLVYRFEFDWQDEDTCGIEVFKLNSEERKELNKAIVKKEK